MTNTKIYDRIKMFLSWLENTEFDEYSEKTIDEALRLLEKVEAVLDRRANADVMRKRFGRGGA